MGPGFVAEREKESFGILSDRREIWKSKKILRDLYEKWYRLIGESLKPGVVLELGGGSGNLKEFFSDALSTDIVPAPWLDAVLDAHRLPFKNESVDSIVLFDVLHHLSAPFAFFTEAERVLRCGGRIVMMEPYVSWSSFVVYRFLHQEGMNLDWNPFALQAPEEGRDPFQGNQAIPTLLLGRYRTEFLRQFPRLKVIVEEAMDFIIYPLSGGFHHPCFIPSLMVPWASALERLLKPLRSVLGFRLFVVAEKN